MHTRRTLVTTLALALLMLALAGTPGIAQGPRLSGDQPQAVPLSTGFTYQGQLKQGGNPVTSNCDFQFGLYDAASLGVQLGVTQTVTSVSVAAGLFTVQLNGGGEFGTSAFAGDARWLAIAVRCPPSSSYTSLGRQGLTAAPYALYSSSTGALQGRAVANEAPAVGKVLKWTGSKWVPDTDNKNPYVRTVIVSPIGDANANGQALIDALGSITGATATNPYLLKIEPGIYDLGTTALVMKENVDIEGSGEDVTTITAAGSTSGDTGTVEGASNAELRFLTVQNTGGNDYAIAIYNNVASPRLTHVTALASGGTINNFGVFNMSSSPAMTNVTARALGSATNNYGVANNSSYPDMTHVTIYAADGTNNYGVYNVTSTPTMVDVIVTAVRGTQSIGVYNSDSSIHIQNSRIVVGSASTANVGVYNVYNSAGNKVIINNCEILAEGYTIYNDTGYTTAVGSSLLDGGPTVNTGGTLNCAGVYDEGYTFYANTCP